MVDQELDELFDGLAAISLDGPKGVGKTETARRRANTVYDLDDPNVRGLLSAHPTRLDQVTPPVLLDEWQRFPITWDWVRRSVDRDNSGGRFLLTGSATPVEAPTHSGAGRIVRIRMRPMTLFERRLASPTVSLTGLLTGRRPLISGDTDVDLPRYADEIVRSGFPGIREHSDRVRRSLLDSYLARIVEIDFPEQGLQVRRPDALRNWLAAYAAATSTTASQTTILRAATQGDEAPTKPTVLTYREVLSQIWMLDPIPGWLPTRNLFTRIGQSPKHQLADPALAASLLGVDQGSLLDLREPGPAIPRDGSLLGSLFESLVSLDLRVYAQLGEARVFHLRTRNGDREIDFIIERADRRVVAVEVKLSAGVEDTDVRHLRWLAARLGDDLLDSVVITTGRHAYRRQDGIAVVPAALLGP